MFMFKTVHPRTEIYELEDTLFFQSADRPVVGVAFVT